MKLPPWAMLVLFLIVVFSVSVIGGLFTASSVGTWYEGLAKPSWRPPNWLFGPVWTLLYAMMAVSAWLVWKKAGFGPALLMFAVQLLINGIWSPVFFGAQSLGGGLVVIVALWFAIVGTIAMFWPVSLAAALLLLPYLAWVSFATVLNAAIWRMNP
ncbi:MAG TPA: tryptophan-rich sensory protein [Candidatus Latescibacteria bacterium]|nr:tryptophan-rich sensory protein [Candidatus Latescibacterota bacterium]